MKVDIHCNVYMQINLLKQSYDSRYRLLDSLVIECWLRMREVPGSIPSQGPRPVPQIRIDVIGYLTPLFLINRVKSKLKGFSDCFHSHNLK